MIITGRIIKTSSPTKGRTGTTKDRIMQGLIYRLSTIADLARNIIIIVAMTTNGGLMVVPVVIKETPKANIIVAEINTDNK